MQLDNAIELKNSLISRNYRAAGQDAATRIQALPVEQIVPSQLSIGYSLHGPDDYHLEIRLKKRGGNAYNAAMEAKARAENEIHVGIMQQQLRVPFHYEAAHGMPKAAPFCLPCRSPEKLHLGLSISHLEGTAGSLGAFVETQNNEQAILSNAHVLGTGKDSPIYHPGKLDAPYGMLAGSDQIASLRNWTTFSTRGANYLDGAYAVLADDIVHNGNEIPPGFPGSGITLTAPTVALEGIEEHGIKAFRDLWHRLNLTKQLEVAKLGRSTGYTTGFITAFAIDDIIVEMGEDGNRRNSITFWKFNGKGSVTHSLEMGTLAA